MQTYLMLGKYSVEAMREISAVRTNEARALIKEHGGTIRGEYALLGEVDLAVIVDLPDNERALKTGVALSELLGVSFRTLPAFTIERFDELMR